MKLPRRRHALGLPHCEVPNRQAHLQVRLQQRKAVAGPPNQCYQREGILRRSPLVRLDLEGNREGKTPGPRLALVKSQEQWSHLH